MGTEAVYQLPPLSIVSKEKHSGAKNISL